MICFSNNARWRSLALAGFHVKTQHIEDAVSNAYLDVIFLFKISSRWRSLALAGFNIKTYENTIHRRHRFNVIIEKPKAGMCVGGTLPPGGVERSLPGSLRVEGTLPGSLHYMAVGCFHAVVMVCFVGDYSVCSLGLVYGFLSGLSRGRLPGGQDLGPYFVARALSSEIRVGILIHCMRIWDLISWRGPRLRKKGLVF